MPAEIEKVHETIIKERSILPGTMVEFNTQAGKIQIIGTEDGFAVRRPEAKHGADIRYNSGNSLTFLNPDGTKTRIVAERPENWQADPVLDPME